jgi:TfoX/Sxy family transcriptional regulator of competence genes
MQLPTTGTAQATNWRKDRTMAYDEGLATRVREVIGDQPGLAEKQMFGGLAFLLHGNMACGVRGDDLIVRVAAETADAAAAAGEPGTRPFDLTGRPMKGWLLVDADGHAEDDDLRRWVDRGLAYASSLPPK